MDTPTHEERTAFPPPSPIKGFPRRRIDERRWVEGPAVGETLHVHFANVGLCPAVQVGLPDTVLIHETTPATHIASFIALQPALMRHNFRLLAWAIAHAGPLKKLFVRLSEWSLRFLRAFLLRNTNSHLALTVIANRGLPDQKAFSLSLQDGQRSTSTATAAAVALWKERHAPPPPGIYTPPALFALEPMLQQMRQLGHPELHLS